MKAFVEINVASGKIKSTLAELRRISGVREVSAVTGHCDILAAIDVRDIQSLSELVVERIQSLNGVVRTETLVCISVE